MAENWLLALALVAGSVVAALAALGLLAALPPRRQALAEGAPPAEETVFLFDGEELVDATTPARSLLAAAGGPAPPWPRLMAYLEARIPEAGAALAALAERGRLRLSAPEGPGFVIEAEWIRGLTRLTLRAGDDAVLPDRLTLRALESELAELRHLADAAPILVWRQAPDGSVTWANRAYLALAAERQPEGEVFTWPLPRLFEAGPAEVAAGAAGRRRARLAEGAGGPRWFDLHSQPAGRDHLVYALPADAAVQAEAALRDFVQTLGKTFAHLPIGLAIFDRRRELQLFNPALADLTRLEPEFLAGRPTLAAFLDRLREKRMLPEPRDYRSWRQRLTALEQSAAAGHHEETWTLPGGQTYRVTGRPHPDGAVAFLIEDISAEITLTRRFRAEIETGQAVLDQLEEAIAVFSPGGVLTVSNAAYGRLWGIDPSVAPGQIGILDALRAWQARAHPAPLWGAARDFVATRGGSAPAGPAGEAELTDGRRIACRFAQLQGGSTLIAFRLLPEGGRGEDGPAEGRRGEAGRDGGDRAVLRILA